jgi:transposase
MAEAAPGRTYDVCSMESCGSWAPGHNGGSCNKYPPYQTCHRCFQQWVREGKLERIMDRDLAERYGIEMIAPHRGERRESTQEGRPLRRYRRRWRVERLFAWPHHFRRLVTGWEYPVENFFGMVRLGCIQILLRQL